MFGSGNGISAKPFPIEQSSARVHKVRVLDDYSKHGRNRATQAFEKNSITVELKRLLRRLDVWVVR
eukprot:2480545-Amphidinium_carterae.2